MNYNALLIKVEEQVALMYRQHANASLFYHNLSHVNEVLDATKKMAVHYKLDDRWFFIVCAAACFHDVGYLVMNNVPHEEKSAELAANYLTSLGVDEADINEVKKGILATRMPQVPTTLAEKIICDADHFYYGSKDFKEKNKQLRLEHEAMTNTKADRTVWTATMITTLENHQYHTDFAQSLLNETKAENLERLRRKQEERLVAQEKPTAVVEAGTQPETIVSGTHKKMLKHKKKDRPAKGIETMFRISSTKSIRLSEMADNKAHIMITVNSIIISVVLGLILYKLDSNPYLLVPSIILLIVNATTIFFAVLATRPKFSDGVFSQEQVDNRSVNLLYFGSYYKMNYREYNEGVKTMMSDSDFLYGTLTRDMYWQGKVLGRKYRLLRICYTMFMFGIMAAILAFLVAIVLFR